MGRRTPPTEEQRRLIEKALGWDRVPTTHDGIKRAEAPPPPDTLKREWTPAWKGELLEALGAGSTVRAACRSVGVHPSVAYDHRISDPEFAAAWKIVAPGRPRHNQLPRPFQSRRGKSERTTS